MKGFASRAKIVITLSGLIMIIVLMGWSLLHAEGAWYMDGQTRIEGEPPDSVVKAHQQSSDPGTQGYYAHDHGNPHMHPHTRGVHHHHPHPHPHHAGQDHHHP